MSSATLFPSDARKQFMTVTGDRHRNMTVRLVKKRLPPPPFTLAQLREYIYLQMHERYDGAIQCRYCRRICDISEVALDHAVPISRGGSIALENIELPCAPCNAIKGDMLPAEFEALLIFLEREIPYARTSILKRLQEHPKLLAGKRRSEMLIRNNGQSLAAPRKPGKPPLVAAIDDAF